MTPPHTPLEQMSWEQRFWELWNLTCQFEARAIKAENDLQQMYIRFVTKGKSGRP